MLYKTFSAAVYGIDPNIIEVEVDVSGIKSNDDHFTPLDFPMPQRVKAVTASAPRSAIADTTSRRHTLP